MYTQRYILGTYKGAKTKMKIHVESLEVAITQAIRKVEAISLKLTAKLEHIYLKIICDNKNLTIDGGYLIKPFFFFYCTL